MRRPVLKLAYSSPRIPWRPLLQLHRNGAFQHVKKRVRVVPIVSALLQPLGPSAQIRSRAWRGSGLADFLDMDRPVLVVRFPRGEAQPQCRPPIDAGNRRRSVFEHGLNESAQLVCEALRVPIHKGTEW